MSQHRKTHARQGRGASNGYNENWRNSPLWDSIEAKKNSKKEQEVQAEVKEHAESTEQVESEESLKAKQRKMFAMVY